ncbi:MAG TPA: hypothetical protein V6C86_10360 [Oculatellaceae cyanobacterium]
MNQEKPCRHEYVRIYQRKLKGLDRRLVSTRAYLPIGFKQTDFSHLSEGSYCFCTKCRARLYPRRTAAEKAAARATNLQAKADALAALIEPEELNLQQLPELLEGLTESSSENDAERDEKPQVDVHVEELELESVDVQDIEAEGVKLMDDDESDNLTGEEDI